MPVQVLHRPPVEGREAFTDWAASAALGVAVAGGASGSGMAGGTGAV